MRCFLVILLLSIISLNGYSQAQNDETTTPEDTPVDHNVLANDGGGIFGLDASSLDLDVSVGGVQQAVDLPEGRFEVTAPGIVTFTPTLNFNGVASIIYEISTNLFETTYQATFTVTVSPVNDPPVITGLSAPISVDEDMPLPLTVSNFTIDDPDNTYPDEFTLQVLEGNNYTFSGNTVTPAANFSGELIINARVTDSGGAQSEAFGASATVNAVNDPPQITEQAQPLSVTEEQSTNIQLSHLTVSDPDNTFPTGFSLSVLEGSNYTVSGNTVTPSPNFNGTLTVNVRVNDGTSDSNTFGLSVTVTPVNDAPEITGQTTTPTVQEDQTITIQLSHLSVTDVDNNYPSGFTLTVLDGTNYSYTGNTVRPATNYNGPLTVNVRGNDGAANSNTFGLELTVNPVNDPPVITGQQALQVNEGQSLSISLSHLTVSDPDDTYPDDFDLSILSGQNYTITGTSIRPANGFSGSLTVRVLVNDGTANSNVFNLMVEVIGVNSAPEFTSTPPTSASIGVLYEYQIEVTDPDSGDDITITAPQKPAWLTLTQQTNGRARLHGTPPGNASGSVTVRLQAQDESNGTRIQEFTITVNIPPTVSNFSVTLDEDVPHVFSTQQFADAFNDPNGDEVEIVRIVEAPRHGDIVLNGQVIPANGEVDGASINALRYRPDNNYHGLDTVTWQAADAVSYSTNDAWIAFTINPINDAPEITALESDVLQVDIAEGPIQVSEIFEVIDVDDDSLTNAEIGFRRQNFVSGDDILIFENTTNIVGNYDQQAGILTLNGKAPIAEYVTAIRSIQYNNVSQEFVDDQDVKTIFYTLNDGKSLSTTRDRQLRIIDNFAELFIPSGFTPGNGDDANDTWVIDNIDQSSLVEVRVYTTRGQLVFDSEGYSTPWDGTYKGELLPRGTYYYTIDMKFNTRNKTYRGTVTILR